MVVLLIIYLIIISIIIFKAFYKSSHFLKKRPFSVRQNTDFLYTSFQIESLSFYPNQWKIYLFAFFINFVLIGLININTVFCMSEQIEDINMAFSEDDYEMSSDFGGSQSDDNNSAISSETASEIYDGYLGLIEEIFDIKKYPSIYYTGSPYIDLDIKSNTNTVSNIFLNLQIEDIKMQNEFLFILNKISLRDLVNKDITYGECLSFYNEGIKPRLTYLLDMRYNSYLGMTQKYLQYHQSISNIYSSKDPSNDIFRKIIEFRPVSRELLSYIQHTIETLDFLENFNLLIDENINRLTNKINNEGIGEHATFSLEQDDTLIKHKLLESEYIFSISDILRDEALDNPNRRFSLTYSILENYINQVLIERNFNENSQYERASLLINNNSKIQKMETLGFKIRE